MQKDYIARLVTAGICLLMIPWGSLALPSALSASTIAEPTQSAEAIGNRTSDAQSRTFRLCGDPEEDQETAREIEDLLKGKSPPGVSVTSGPDGCIDLTIIPRATQVLPSGADVRVQGSSAISLSLQVPASGQKPARTIALSIVVEDGEARVDITTDGATPQPLAEPSERRSWSEWRERLWSLTRPTPRTDLLQEWERRRGELRKQLKELWAW